MLDAIGRSTDPITQTVDRRWLLAYSMCVGADLPALTDTRRPDGIMAHPLFPVAVEWPSVRAAQRLVPPQADLLPGVHATHDLTVHRPAREGDELTTVATIEEVREERYGLLQVLRLDTEDAAGRPVATTRMGLAFRRATGAARKDPRASTASAPAPDPPPALVESRLRLPNGLAHAYTECAHIWNPIHTDRAVAEAAGLPEPILHGTCTLAVAVSRLLHLALDDDPTRVARVRARFAAYVTLPSVLTLRFTRPDDRAIELTACRDDGRAVLADGVVELAERKNL